MLVKRFTFMATIEIYANKRGIGIEEHNFMYRGACVSGNIGTGEHTTGLPGNIGSGNIGRPTLAFRPEHGWDIM